MKKKFPQRIEVDEIMNLSTYAYIQEKACHFLEVGFLDYSKNDAFNLPGEDLTTDEVSLLKSGCEQFRDKKGVTRENPFEGLGIKGFYQLMKMFHFVALQQETKGGGEEFIIDKITFQHRVLKKLQRIVLFNKVRKH